MRSILILVFFLSSFWLFSQAVIGRPWSIEIGTSTNTFFNKPPSINLRYISPRFKWSNYELTAEEEKKPEKFKNMRLMIELIYTPPLEVLCTGFNAQYRFLRYKRLSLELYGGLKLFFIPGLDFASIPPLSSGKGDAWYFNLGLLCQLNLGIVAPFIDFGGDTIFTVGMELNLITMYRKPKRRYNLDLNN